MGHWVHLKKKSRLNMIVVELFVCWEIVHAFLLSTGFIQKQLFFEDKRFRNAIELLNFFIQIRRDPFSQA